MTSANESQLDGPESRFVETTLTEEQLRAAVALSQINDGVDKASAAAEVAKFRDGYQQLNIQLGEQITRVLEKRADDSDLNVPQLVEKLDEISGTFEKVSCGRELAADAQVLKTVSKFGFVRAQAFQEANAGKTLNVKSFAKKLLTVISKREERAPSEFGDLEDDSVLRRWARFAVCHDSKIFKSVPALSTLRPFLLADEPVAQPKKERVKYEKDKSEGVKLKALSAETATKETADLTRQLDNVYRCLKQQLKRAGSDRIGYYEFCLHPTDFARTVENVFYISFLVKEAKVKIIRPEGALPQIARVSEAEKEELHVDDRTKVQASQGVVALSVSQWRELVRLLNITEAAIRSL